MDAETRLYAHAKRFRERWDGDDRFRAAAAEDPAEAARAAGIDCDPRGLSWLWRPGAEVDESLPEVRAMRRYEARDRAYLAFTDDDAGAGAGYRVWRRRQRARAMFAQGPLTAAVGLHLPFVVELTRGCSLGCWFCGLSAGKLEAALPTDLPAWSRMLRAFRAVFGASARRGFLYWATDPLDHPDYESHAETFDRELGRFPVTTTAAMLKDVERTRRLIRLSRERGSPSLRFSIVTRQALDRVHRTFSAEELIDVGLVLVNKESVLALAEAGHARERAGRDPERAAFERAKLRALTPPGADPAAWTHRTIACVSGFLVEPVVGRLRLIAPEPCSDRWPDGYAVFDEARFDFDEPGAFDAALAGIAERRLHDRPPARLALQREVRIELTGDAAGAAAAARGHRIDYRAGARSLRHLPALADAFRGGAEVEAAARDVARGFGLRAELVRADIERLWRDGVLIETMFDLAAAAPRAARRPPDKA